MRVSCPAPSPGDRPRRHAEFRPGLPAGLSGSVSARVRVGVRIKVRVLLVTDLWALLWLAGLLHPVLPFLDSLPLRSPPPFEGVISVLLGH